MKHMKILRNNGGFTLVELIISVGILAVISLIVALIVKAGAGTYSNISSDLNLQVESQTAMSQIQEVVLDCNAYIAAKADGSALYVFNQTDGNSFQAYKIALSASTNELYFYTKTLLTSSFTPSDANNFTFGAGQPMSSYVRQFIATVATDGRSVDIILNYGIGSRTFNGRQTVALRNQAANISAYAG